jgi:hypothetical protein
MKHQRKNKRLGKRTRQFRGCGDGPCEWCSGNRLHKVARAENLDGGLDNYPDLGEFSNHRILRHNKMMVNFVQNSSTTNATPSANLGP